MVPHGLFTEILLHLHTMRIQVNKTLAHLDAHQNKICQNGGVYSKSFKLSSLTEAQALIFLNLSGTHVSGVECTQQIGSSQECTATAPLL